MIYEKYSNRHDCTVEIIKEEDSNWPRGIARQGWTLESVMMRHEVKPETIGHIATMGFHFYEIPVYRLLRIVSGGASQ